MSSQEKWIKIKDAAQMAGVSQQRIRTLIRNKRFATKETKFKRYVLVDREDIEQYRLEREMVGEE